MVHPLIIGKPRTESTTLKALKFLNTRMSLSEEDKRYYLNLLKGYEGEIMFDSMTEKLECDCIILNDLLLEVNNSTFQIDTLIITSEIIYPFEVKNNSGDYYYESDKMYTMNKIEINNPLNQLRKNNSLLNRLLHLLGHKLPIVDSVVFINPEFTLYQAPMDLPLIFPGQVHRTLQKVDATRSKLTRQHKLLAEKLVSLHMDDSRFSKLPSYNYHSLRKGIVCKNCHSFLVSISGSACICQNCHTKESVTEAVIRSANEFQLLFPNEKMTTGLIHDWCKIVSSKKRISRILQKNFKQIYLNRWTYFK